MNYYRATHLILWIYFLLIENLTKKELKILIKSDVIPIGSAKNNHFYKLEKKKKKFYFFQSLKWKINTRRKNDFKY